MKIFASAFSLATAGLSSLVLFGVPIKAGAQVGPFDFETSGQYSGNFYAVSAGGELGQTTGLPNNYLQLNDIAGQNGAIYYGTSANTSLEPTFGGTFTVQFDVSAVTGGSAFGVYLVNPSNPANSLLAYFNLDYSGTSDEIRFFMNGNPANATSTAGTRITTGITGAGGTLSSGTYSGDSGLNVSGDNYTGGTSLWGTMDVTYTPGSSPNTTTLSLSLGSLSATATIPDSEAILDPAIAIRMVDAGNNVPGTAKIDNFSISESPIPVPEPSTVALIGLSLGLAAFKVSRKKLS